MRKIKNILLVLAMVVIVGGCGKNECKCPDDTGGSTNDSYEVIKNDYSELYSETATSVVMVRVQRRNDKSQVISTGSGVVAFEEGEYAYIYTNAHVVKGVTTDYEVEVMFSNDKGFMTGESEVATLIGKDLYEDVAVLSIKKSNKYKVAVVGNSDKVEKGDWIYTIGSPLGKFNYTTEGNISTIKTPIALDSSKTGVSTTVYALMFDAPINEGNSGGALFNEAGELIGITTLKYDEVYGMYGALPINYFSKVARHLMINGVNYVRPALNLALISINEMGTRREDYGISNYVKTGVYIQTSLENNVDITAQSIITEINGKAINSTADFGAELLKYNIGDSITLTLINKTGLYTRNVTVVLHV